MLCCCAVAAMVETGPDISLRCNTRDDACRCLTLPGCTPTAAAESALSPGRGPVTSKNDSVSLATGAQVSRAQTTTNRLLPSAHLRREDIQSSGVLGTCSRLPAPLEGRSLALSNIELQSYPHLESRDPAPSTVVGLLLEEQAERVNSGRIVGCWARNESRNTKTRSSCGLIVNW